MKPARHLATYAALILGGLAAGVALLVAIELTLRRLNLPPERGLFTAAVAPDCTSIMRLSWNPQFNKPQEPQAQRDFLATKSPGTFRIFVVGESSAEGSPYGTSLAFSSWLARRLAAEVPEIRWEVVNAAWWAPRATACSSWFATSPGMTPTCSSSISAATRSVCA
jgi:hypothetical protein